MNQINLILDCDVRNLDRMLKPIRARLGAEFVAVAYNTPDDCYDPVLRVGADGGFYDFPGTVNGNGEWTFRVLPTAFRRVGVEWYEVRATSADGQPTAIGRGLVNIGEWSAGTAQTLDAARRVVMTIADAQGAQHPVFAVKNDIGEWTYQFGDALDPDTPTVPVTAIGGTDGGGVSVVANTDGGEPVVEVGADR